MIWLRLQLEFSRTAEDRMTDFDMPQSILEITTYSLV